jgi:hypothetical protein
MSRPIISSLLFTCFILVFSLCSFIECGHFPVPAPAFGPSTRSVQKCPFYRLGTGSSPRICGIPSMSSSRSIGHSLSHVQSLTRKSPLTRTWRFMASPFTDNMRSTLQWRRNHSKGHNRRPTQSMVSPIESTTFSPVDSSTSYDPPSPYVTPLLDFIG